MYFVAGQDVTVAVDLKVGGEFVVPDIGSVSYLVKNAAGSTIVPSTDITTDSNTTQVQITVSADNNSKSMTVEPRFIVVTFKVGGKPYQVRQVYKLIDFLLYTVSEEDVRSFIGVTEYELPDTDIDLVKAYYKVVADFEDLALAFIDEAKADDANQCVLTKAVLLVCDSLQLRLLASEEDADRKVRRFSNPDFDSIKSNAASLYASSLLALTGALEGAVPLFSISQPTDPVTGQ